MPRLDYGEHGDVQTCVAMMLVLGEAACKDVPVPRQLDWFHTYVELLDRMGLHNQRAEVICASHLGEIKVPIYPSDLQLLITPARSMPPPGTMHVVVLRR